MLWACNAAENDQRRRRYQGNGQSVSEHLLDLGAAVPNVWAESCVSVTSRQKNLDWGRLLPPCAHEKTPYLSRSESDPPTTKRARCRRRAMQAI